MSPYPLSKNELYDRLTEKIIIKTCHKNSVCVDVGAHDGKILALFIRHCPLALHYAFEPLPHLFKLRVRKYGSACQVFQIALGNKNGVMPFNYVVSDAAYSGLQSRADLQHYKEITIEVGTDLMDHVIPLTMPISLIKIDVEGGELDVLKGAKQLISTHKPNILFEFGKGGSDAFEVTTKMMYAFFKDMGYEISLLSSFLHKKPSLSFDDFEKHYQKGDEYFFIAQPVIVTSVQQNNSDKNF